MQFILQKVWELLLPISLPWQIIIVFFALMLLLPWLLLRCLPFGLSKLLLFIVFFTKIIIQFCFFIEYTFTKNIRKNKQKPPTIFYILSDVLIGIVRAMQFFKINSEHLYITLSNIPWVFRPKGLYALPIVLIPIWYASSYLSNSSITTFINSSVAWWCSLEHWIMTSDWIPSNLTCHYPNSSPRWNSSLKAKEYKLKKEIKKNTSNISLQPNNPDFYFNRGNAYLALENIKDAYKDYTSSVKVDHNFAPGFVGRGNIYSIKKDKSGAFKEYSKAISINSKYIPGYIGLGDIYLAMNKNKEAFKQYTNAVNIDAKYASAYVGRGNVYQKIGDKDAALKEYGKAIEVDPEYAFAYERMGNLYYSGFNNLESAIEEYEKAASIFLKTGQINSYNQVRDILNELSRYEIYTVKSGDSLSKIAKKHNISLQTIISANKNTYPQLVTNSDNLAIGWKLKIPQQ